MGLLIYKQCCETGEGYYISSSLFTFVSYLPFPILQIYVIGPDASIKWWSIFTSPHTWTLTSLLAMVYVPFNWMDFSSSCQELFLWIVHYSILQGLKWIIQSKWVLDFCFNFYIFGMNWWNNLFQMFWCGMNVSGDPVVHPHWSNPTVTPRCYSPSHRQNRSWLWLAQFLWNRINPLSCE